jgi:peptidoglycan/xylan/chitin deacetylase (PgdA/CDA1 family)
MTCVIYTCHNVVPLAAGTEERGTIDLNTFLRQLSWLRRFGVRFIPMSDLRAWLLGSKKIPKRSAVLTFDDALISIAEHVFFHLKQQEIPITIFVIAGLIGGESNFSNHPAAPSRRHLDLGQLKMMLNTGLVEIGAHGYHHVNFTRVGGDDLWQEICHAKEILETSLELEVPYLAYPWGNTTDAVIHLAKEAGYLMGFTTQKKKLNSKNIDLLRIPRVTWSRRATLFKLSKYYLIPWLRSAGDTEDR